MHKLLRESTYIILPIHKYYVDETLFRVCGNNEDKLPIKMSSTSNEFSLFFRSSLKISGRGFNCSYSITPITKAPSKVKNHNGDGKICIL